MKKLFLLLVPLVFFFVGCDENTDSNGDVPEMLYGCWEGYEISSVTGSKATLSLILNEDLTGEFAFQSKAYMRYASFTYMYQNNIVVCRGVQMGQDGNMDYDWEKKFKYTGSCLIPQDSPYQNIVLYKDEIQNSDFETEDNNDSPSVDDQGMALAVSNRVSDTYEYENYCYYITIETSLSDKYPDKNFKYGIEMGYGSYDYYTYASGSGNRYHVEQPVFIYADGSSYANLMFNWSSYQSLLKSLEEKGSFSDSEKDLYNSIVKEFNKYENSAKSSFQYRVFVEVDGRKYYNK